MKHMNPSKIAQTHKIADLVQQLKAGAILRGALPTNLQTKRMAA